MAGIASPGVGSGLDVKTLVASLMKIEQQPLVRLNQKEAVVQAGISAYGALKASLASLQSTLTTLETETTYQATSAASSDTDVLTASSDETAVGSSYSVTVSRLAQEHKIGSTAVASSATFGGGVGDELTITVGSNSFDIDLSSALTLEEIQTAINVESNATNATAGLITGDSGNQTLVLTSGSSGYSDRVQLSYGGAINSSTFNFSMLNRDASNVLLSAEAELDASLSVDGASVTRSSNSITDVVSGLTLDLKDTGQSTVTIAQDTSIAKSAVDAFIKTYNTLRGQLSDFESNGANGSIVRNVETQLRNVLNTEFSGLGEYSYLSELGVTSNALTGQLEFDSAMLTDALAENPDSIKDFFSDSSGFATVMDSLLEGFVGSGGTIDSVVGGAQDQISRISSSRDSLSRRLEGVERRYNDQFTALDVLMASMTSTSNYLGRQLDILDSIVTGKK